MKLRRPCPVHIWPFPSGSKQLLSPAALYAAGGENQQLREKLFQETGFCFESVMFPDRSTSVLIILSHCLSQYVALSLLSALPNYQSDYQSVKKSQSFTKSDSLSFVCLSQNVVLLQSVSLLEASHSVSPTLSYCLVSMSFCLLALSNSVCM